MLLFWFIAFYTGLKSVEHTRTENIHNILHSGEMFECLYHHIHWDLLYIIYIFVMQIPEQPKNEWTGADIRLLTKRFACLFYLFVICHVIGIRQTDFNWCSNKNWTWIPKELKITQSVSSCIFIVSISFVFAHHFFVHHLLLLNSEYWNKIHPKGTNRCWKFRVVIW